MTTIPLKRLLLVDDSPRDTEMTLDALAQNGLANEVVALRDGVEALDYLYRRGEFADRASGNPAVILLDLKMPKVDGIEVLYPYALNRSHSGASADAVAALVAQFRQVAAAHGLLITGGSDYHGTVKPGILPGMAGLTAQEWDILAARCGWQGGMVNAE